MKGSESRMEPAMPRLPLALALSGLGLIAACSPTPSDGVPDPADLAFMGSWDCGVTVMTFMPDSYLSSNEAEPVAVAGYRDIGSGATEITLAGGDRMVVQSVTDTGMNWFSHQSGDSFDCTRVAG